MKVLTKYFKVALCFMAFALCSFMFAFTPTLTAVQAAEMAVASYNLAINALKMPTEEVNYENGDVFKVPLLKSVLGESSADYTIRVIDPAGYKHDYVINGSENDENYFALDGADLGSSSNVIVNAKNNGEYKIIYITTSGDRTYYSNTYKVTVSNVSYELDFSTPILSADNKIVGYQKNLMPTKMAVSNTVFELPVAYAKIAGQDLTINGSNGKVENFSTLTEDESLKVKVSVTKDGAPQKQDETGSVFTSNAGKLFITPSEAGVYTIEYSYENSANRPTKTFTITVEEGYVASDLKLASTPTMPTIELGKKITLPKLTVNAGSEKNVEVNVASIRIEKESNSNIYCELTNNNFEFEMKPENFAGVTNFEDMVGNYRITYSVKDVNGKTLVETFKVDGVTVASKPTIKLAYNYDKTASNLAEKVVFGAETELKAEYEANNEFVLPAVYVEDAVTTDYNDFTIIRTIRKGSTYYYIDNKKYDEETGTFTTVTSTEKGYNASEDTNIGDVSKAVKFKFNTEGANLTNIEGTYYLEYRVITKEVKERESYLYVDGTTEKYTFKVVASGAHTKTTPTIEITNLKDSSVKNTEDITVKVTSTDDLDTRLKNVVFTYSSKNAGSTLTLKEYIAEVIDSVQNASGYEKTSHILEDERFITGLSAHFNDLAIVEESETKNSFNVDLTGKTGTVNVVAVTINDDGNIAIDEKVLTIKDTNDSVAPEIKIHLAQGEWQNGSGEIQEFKVGQGKEVKLPTVYAVDNDKTLSLNVMYYIDSPENSYGGVKYLSPVGKSFAYSSTIVPGQEVQVINGGTITTSETGIYYIAYTATDVAGNTSVMYFTFEVVDTSKPILSVETVADDVTIAGNTVTGGKGTVVDFESTVRSADGKNNYTADAEITITVEDNGKGLDYQPSGNSRTSYQFNDYGTYVVTISANYDDREADSKVIKVVIEKQPIEWLGEFDVPQYASKKSTVKLPDIAASNGAVVKVTYLAPGAASSEAKDATKVSENGYTYWTFETNETSKGTYTVTYTATTDDDVLTKTISIKVGDNVAPTLNFNKGELTQDLIYDGANDIEYVLEVNKTKKTFVVKAINNGSEVYAYNIGLTISDKDDTGSVNSNMSWTNLSYELTGANVSTGNTSTSNGTTTTQYLISGTGKYTLKLTMKDSYDNERVETIEFNVVEKSSVKENKDNVVGAVLIIVSLVLLAGVILFFTFTGKKGKGSKKVKTSKVKATKVENKVEENNEEENVVIEETKEAEVEEKSAEVVEDKTEEVAEEKIEVASEEVVEEKVDEEPKSDDVK